MDTKMRSAVAEAELLYPPYWLVSGLLWNSDGPPAEAAVAVAPTMIPREALRHDARQVVGCADLYARKHSLRVVFSSDVSRMFTKAGTSWAQLGVDYENAQRELHSGSFPAMFLTISERMYLCIGDAAPGKPTPSRLDTDEAPSSDRELARHAITRQLASDWPAYMETVIDTGRVSFTD